MVGGFNPPFDTKTEIIDLINPMNVCKPWADHPTGTYEAAGAFINNALHICGGTTPDESFSDDCNLIGPTSAKSTTSLRKGSESSAALTYKGALLYTGGESKYFSKIRNKVDITHVFLILFQLQTMKQQEEPKSFLKMKPFLVQICLTLLKDIVLSS